MAAPAQPTPRINVDRLMKTLHETCQWGAAHRYGPGPTETGMDRLALNDDDKKVREWFVNEVQNQGCKVSVDEMGNIFAVRPGKREGPPTAMGSHLDTQPRGGRYDGILGVMSAIEALRTLNDNKIETEYPVGIVNWTNEEGARFPKSVVSSAVWAEVLPLETAHSLADVHDASATMKSELQRIGFLGPMKCSYKTFPLACHFEIHIEQGPILEREKLKVGVVQGAQSYRWFTLTVKGRESHTGSTPFESRSDSLLCASKIIVASNEIAKAHGALASTGIITVSPSSVNTTAGEVSFSLDIRASEDDTVYKLEAAIRERADVIAKQESERGCTVDWTLDYDSPQVKFHKDCIGCVSSSAIETVGKENIREIFSGAGHDSCATSQRVPTSMIFVPSKDGLSHNPHEYTSDEECGYGAQTLLGAVLRYDALRASRS